MRRRKPLRAARRPRRHTTASGASGARREASRLGEGRGARREVWRGAERAGRCGGARGTPGGTAWAPSALAGGGGAAAVAIAMLRRKPTRLELKLDDIEEFESVRKDLEVRAGLAKAALGGSVCTRPRAA